MSERGRVKVRFADRFQPFLRFYDVAVLAYLEPALPGFQPFLRFYTGCGRARISRGLRRVSTLLEILRSPAGTRALL